MTKTLEIDDGLLEAARRLTGEHEDRAAVERILRTAIDARENKNAALLDLVRKVDFYEGFDPKALGPAHNDLG
jgi:Arc/MetJ family transcription regulator